MNNIPNEIILLIINQFIIKDLHRFKIINVLWNKLCNECLNQHNKKWHYRMIIYMKVIKDQMLNFYVRYPNRYEFFLSSTIAVPRLITSNNNNLSLHNITIPIVNDNTCIEIRLENVGYRTKYIFKRLIDKILYIDGTLYEYDYVNISIIPNIKCDICNNIAFLPIMLRYVDEYEDLEYRMLYSIVCLKCMSCHNCGYNSFGVINMDSIISNCTIQFICNSCAPLEHNDSAIDTSSEDNTPYYNKKDIKVMIGYTEEEIKISTYCFGDCL